MIGGAVTLAAVVNAVFNVAHDAFDVVAAAFYAVFFIEFFFHDITPF